MNNPLANMNDIINANKNKELTVTELQKIRKMYVKELKNSICFNKLKAVNTLDTFLKESITDNPNYTDFKIISNPVGNLLTLELNPVSSVLEQAKSNEKLSESHLVVALSEHVMDITTIVTLTCLENIEKYIEIDNDIIKIHFLNYFKNTKTINVDLDYMKEMLAS